MSSATISRFPQFADGDVLVILDGKRIFKLHATILRNNSTGFKRLLQEEQGAKLTRRAKEEGNTVRWRLDLEWMGMGHGVFVNRVSRPAVFCQYVQVEAPSLRAHWSGQVRPIP